MRAVCQRVSRARVLVDGDVVRTIGQGRVFLLGIGPQDYEAAAVRLVDKIVLLRVFEDEVGKMNLSEFCCRRVGTRCRACPGASRRRSPNSPSRRVVAVKRHRLPPYLTVADGLPTPVQRHRHAPTEVLLLESSGQAGQCAQNVDNGR